MPALGPSPYRSLPRRPRTVHPGVPGHWVVFGLFSVIVLFGLSLVVLRNTIGRRVVTHAAPAPSLSR